VGQAEISKVARWQAPPFIKASAALHAVGATALVAAPTTWPWVIGAIVANHAGITAAGLWPRSRLLGANITRLPPSVSQRNEVALTFDDGPDPEVTPAELDLLDACDMKASFFCIGTRAAQYPELVREIVRRGHSVENHSHCHPAAFSFYGVGRMRKEIHAAQQTLTALSGATPHYFRAPAGLRNPMLDPALNALGLQLVSWTRRGFDGVSKNGATVLARLTRDLAAGDILVLHDGQPPRTANNVPVVLEVLPPLLRQLQSSGLRSVSLPHAFA
jgi:peptidoglycan/xylan/chitin deacetylase (PgdA/CDA1 family)